MNDPTSMDVDSISVVDHQSLSMSPKLIKSFRTQAECDECERFLRSCDQFEYGSSL